MKWPWQRDESATEARLDALLAILEASGGPIRGDTGPDASQGLSEAIARNELAISQLRHDHAQIRGVVASAIQHEERREKRIRATVTRARKELAERELEDPAIEAEWGQLSVVDGEGSREEELPDVPAGVADDLEDPPSSIPGVSRSELLRARGLM